MGRGDRPSIGDNDTSNYQHGGPFLYNRFYYKTQNKACNNTKRPWLLVKGVIDIYFVRYYNLVILRLKFYEMILVSVFDFRGSKIFMKGEDFMLNKVG